MITVRQVVSRDHQILRGSTARLTVGRDGKVYFGIGEQTSRGLIDAILRTTSAGTDRVAVEAPARWGLRNVTANADGVMARCDLHHSPKVTVLNPDFTEAGTVEYVRVDPDWSNPMKVEAEKGPGGTFWVLNRIVDGGVVKNMLDRISSSPPIRVVQSAPIPATDLSTDQAIDMRVLLRGTLIVYVLYRRGAGGSYVRRLVGRNAVLGEEGRMDVNVFPDDIPQGRGGWEVDDDEVLYLLRPEFGKVVQRWKLDLDAAGKPRQTRQADLTLSGDPPWTAVPRTIRVQHNVVYVQLDTDDELFRCYSLETGSYLRTVEANRDTLTAQFPGDDSEFGPWTAGTTVTVTLTLERHEGGQVTVLPQPRWRVWARTLGCLDYRELVLTAKPGNGFEIAVPPDLTGVIQLKITAETAGWQRGVEPDWAVRRSLEVRAPRATGSVSVVTRTARSTGNGRNLSTEVVPANRMYYGRGEPIDAVLILRGTAPATARVDLVDSAGTVIASRSFALTPAGGRAAQQFTVSAGLTALLRPGDHRLRVTSAGLTPADQPLKIGPGLTAMPFPFTQHGDYGPMYPWTDPVPTIVDTPDRVAAHLERTRRLGVRLFVERLGGVRKVDLDSQHATADTLALYQWLGTQGSVAQERARSTSSASQSLAGYGAYGVRLMSILFNMDTFLPFRDGKLNDGRTREEVLADLDQVSAALAYYPAFRGWTWAANWWMGYDQNGQNLTSVDTQAQTDPQYRALVERSRVTGRWDPAHDTRSDERFTVGPTLWRLFTERFRQQYPQLVTAVTGTVNNPNAYPPKLFADVDEVDLHLQFESFTVPGFTALVQDLSRRPGKRSLLHAEHTNDPGTGEQLLTMHGLALLRGADSGGTAGKIPHPFRYYPEDSRSAYPGMASVYRALGALLGEYGPWLSTLRGADRVAILLSERAFRLQSAPLLPTHVHRVHEAYLSCLLAGFPATLVFVEDLARRPLTGFDAVLLVDEQFELAPQAADAVRAARAAGVPVFHDGTCNAEVIPETTPLGVAFNRVSLELNMGWTDSATGEWRAGALAHVPALRRVLSTVSTPVAEVTVDGVTEPEVLVSERRAEQGRYLFVANDAVLGLDQGLLRRTAGGTGNRAPLTARIDLLGRTGVVYDVFAGTRVTPVGGAVTAELRHLPFAVFAVLPVEIAAVRLNVTESILPTREVEWVLDVADRTGAVIQASVPVRMTIRDSAGSLLDERIEATGSAGIGGRFTVPVTAAPGPVILTATELISGRAARAIAAVEPITLPLDLTGDGTSEIPAVATTPSPAVSIARPVGEFRPARERFGAKLRGLAVSANGGTGVLAGFDWDDNLHGIDLTTGNLRWQRRIGQHFAFAPRACGAGFAVTGTFFDRPQGYGLYLLGADGVPTRRFDRYGLPTRLGYRATQSLMQRNDGDFAVAPGGGWVADSGSLGLVVWDVGGAVRWRRDIPRNAKFGSTGPALIAPVSDDRLLVVDGTKVSLHPAGSASPLWTVDLLAVQSGTRSPGVARTLVVSADRKTCAVLTSCRGGLVFVLDLGAGALRAVLPVDCSQAVLSAEGARLAVIVGNQVRCYDVATPGAARWVYGGDDLLRDPVFGPDGRLAVGTEIGTLVVLDTDGNLLLERDFEALPAPAWLPGGDLLVATWMGEVQRLGGSDYAPRWRTKITCSGPDVRGRLLAPDTVLISRIDGWSNADPTPRPLRPNLLSGAIVQLPFLDQRHPDFLVVADGVLAPREVLAEWPAVELLAERPGIEAFLTMDFRRQVKVTALTVVEDQHRPESWWRDLRLDYQNPAGAWVTAGPLLSDAAVHSHTLPGPVTTTLLRLKLPERPTDLPRLAEIVVHGSIG